MKAILQTLALFLTIGLGTASAQNIHFQSGPTITDLGTTLKVCGKLVGLGNNQLVTVSISGTQVVTTQCTNPGGNVAPGQTQTTNFMASGSYMSSKNGNVAFCLTTTEPTPGTCPNGQWTGTVTGTTFSNVTVSVNGVPVTN
jgi:hypothetical protein